MTTMRATTAELSIDDFPRVVDDLARRYAKALALAIGSISERAEERASAIARGGLPSVRRILADIIGAIEAVERRVEAIGDDRQDALVETALRLNGLSNAVQAIQAIRSADVRGDRRILEILADPLAMQLPRLALAVCAHSNMTAAAAIEALRIVATTAPSPLPDPGADRLQ